jgi:hypothetical protein
VRTLVIALLTTNGLSQIIRLKEFTHENETEWIVVELAMWFIWFLKVFLIAFSYKKNCLKLIYPSIVITLVRNLMPLMNFDGRLTDLRVTDYLFINIQSFAIMVI